MNEHLPFNLPDELCEIIFNQLLPCDLLSCLVVNLCWHHYILESKCCDKLVLRIGEALILDDVLTSERRFTSLSFDKLQHEKIINFLDTFHSTVRKIVIKDCSLAAKDDVVKFSFESLEELTLSNVSGRILFPFMNFHENLKVLNLHQLRGGIESLINFMRLNKNLKELNLYLNESSNIFHHDISNIFRFNLESLTISFRSNYELDDRTVANAERFLKSQGNTLKTIGLINAVSFSSIYHVWNFMKAAEKFYFFSVDPFANLDENIPILEVSERLKALEIHILGPLNLKISELKPMLKATKNLKSLGVWKLNKDTVEYAAENLSQLKNIFCATSSDDCKSFYEQLKTKNGINSAIKIHQYL